MDNGHLHYNKDLQIHRLTTDSAGKKAQIKDNSIFYFRVGVGVGGGAEAEAKVEGRGRPPNIQ